MSPPAALALVLVLAACGTEPAEPEQAEPPAGSIAAPGAPPTDAPAAPAAPGSGDDVAAAPAHEAPPGTAPLSVAVPQGLFDEVEVRCAGGATLPGAPEEAGAKALVMVHGLPQGESCALFLKGSIVSRLSPVTAGQRWSCRFRRAEPICKHLGGPEGPTIATPEDWPWDKVENKPVSKGEARAFDEAQESKEAQEVEASTGEGSAGATAP